VALSSLQPLQVKLLWDIGLVRVRSAIEWLLRHPILHAIASRRAATARAGRPATPQHLACRSLRSSGPGAGALAGLRDGCCFIGRRNDG